MSKSISLGVLAAKLDLIHDDIRAMKQEVKENTEFRLQAKGIIGVVAMFSSLVGGLVLFIIQKIWR